MFCPSCGTNNDDKARFCYRCGHQLSDGSAPASPSGPAWRDFREPEPPPVEAPTPAPYVEPVIVIPPAPPTPTRRGILPLVAALPALVVAGAVFAPWLSIAGIDVAGRHFDLGKATLAIAAVALAGLVYRYLASERRVGAWLAVLAYAVAAAIAARNLIDSDALAGSHGADAGWGLYVGLVAAIVGVLLTLVVIVQSRRRRPAIDDAIDDYRAPLVPYLPPPDTMANNAASYASTAANVISDPVGAMRQAVGQAATNFASSGTLPQSPLSAQIVVGRPKSGFPFGLIVVVLLFLAIVGGGAFGVYYASQHLDLNTASLPLIGKKDKAGANSTSTPGILVSLSVPCKDTTGKDCNLIWDVTDLRSDAQGVRITYAVRATGQGDCSVQVEADKAVAARLEAAGRAGPFLEGARGRYYPLTGSDGFGLSAGALSCGSKQAGAWLFAPVTGESVVKLRYPSLPPAQFELSPVSARLLPPDDPFSVIPVQSQACQTTTQQPCSSTWEIGPYGLGSDGAPIVFFALRFDGPANCQVAWQNDPQSQKDLVAKGDKGIRLELANNGGTLALTGGGGLSTQNGAQACGRVLFGFWRFAPGSLTSVVDLNYPDFAPVQLPIRP